ncbi:carcinoembryonic antigen-related cell adhesion molecule 1-like [Toxotes jaculatrix]|uniref:carcinoembryonic antigen-related cell adhesion molecule 1-like n=1 Tax=Toxotes jaculatrix TaxID=941984 RepID=UPI001B3A7E74|nr:carcinoembryonic antigen-related cell adhesion molecule 1-like [Toxotes jaculatrix]
MDMLFLLFIVCVTFTGVSEGAGVLPDDSLNAAVGGSVMFTTTLSPPGTPFLSVTWAFGVKQIITSHISNFTEPEYEGRITLFRSTGSLELRNLTVSDSGEYGVTITPADGVAVLGQTRLEIHVPVSNVRITASSTDLVEFNSSVSLSCSSSGSSLSFLWLNGSSEVTASERVQLTDGNSTLSIYNVTRYDQGPFKCHVFNLVSDGTSGPVNLSISFGPENINLKLLPSQDHYEEGSNISLSCSAVSRPAAQFQWFVNGDLLSDTGPELRLMNIQESQSGNYSCQAFNNVTMRYQTSQPSVIFALKRISGASVKSSTNQSVEGNSVNLTCEASGTIFTRKWRKDGSDLILNDNMILYNNNRVLSFQPLKRPDSGEYSCDISNPVSSEEAKYSMVVNYGPENVQIKGPREMTLTHTLKLNCSADSTPTAIYTWKLNDTEILSNSAVFTKKVSELSDSGNYTCEATNHITGRTSSAVHGLSVTVSQPSSCSAGCIAGIVIGCCVFFGVIILSGFCIYKKKKEAKKSNSNRNTGTSTRDEGKSNAAYSGSQELNYADIRFFQNRDGGTVQLGLQNNSSEYSQVRANNRPPTASSPPTYDAHMQRKKTPAPQPGANGEQTYA